MEADLSGIVSIFILLLMGGLCSLTEASLGAISISRLRSLSEEDKKRYRRVLKAVEKNHAYELRLCVIFFNIAAGFSGGFYLSHAFKPFFTAWPPAVGLFVYPGALILVSLCSFIFSGILPRKPSFSASETIALRLLPLTGILSLPLRPLILFSGFVSQGVLGFFRIRAAEDAGMTEDELRTALREGEKSGIVETEERSMVEGVFYLGDRPVGTFMTHRSEIEWLNIDADLVKIRALLLKCREQRFFPVVQDSLDQIIGIAAAKDILAALLEEEWPGMRAIMKEPVFVPETMSALKAFNAFKRSDVNYLLVMDEYGGFTGVLSLLDLVEEIVGELSTPEAEEDAIVKLEDGSYLVDGSVNIDDIAEMLSLPSLVNEHQDYHTLAGFILNLTGEIPRTGANIGYEGYTFKIVDMDGNRIDKVQIYLPSEKQPVSNINGK
jgi:putative hemolysin